MDNHDLIRRAEDLHQRSINQGIVTHTNFLTPAEQYTLKNIPHLSPGLHTSGGGADCERQAVFFLPEYLSPADFDPQDYLTAFHVLCRFAQPGHRDILGSLLGLGIARWSLGDIYTRGEEAWFFCLPSVADHITRELTHVGRGGAKVTELPLAYVPPPERQREELSFTASSLRLDVLLAGTFRLSRDKAAESIATGLVSLNYTICQKPAALLAPGDVFSLRGHGKARLAELGGKSRKDRTFVTVEKYL